MPFCPQCGKQLETGELCSCPKSVAKRKAAQTQETMKKAGAEAQKNIRRVGEEVDLAGGIGKSIQTVKDNIKDCYEGLFRGKYYEIGEDVIPNNVDANDSEVAIKQYDNIARLKTVSKLSWAFGKILLTNKRLIFRAPGYSPINGKTILQYEFALDKLAGFEAKKEHKFSVWDLIGAMFVSSVGGGISAYIMTELIKASRPLCLIFGILLGLVFMFPVLVLANTRHSYFKLLFASASSTAVAAGMAAARDMDSEFLSYIMLALTIVAVLILLIITIRVIFPLELSLVFNTDGGSKVVAIKRKPWVGIFAFLFGIEPPETFTGFSQVQPYKNTDETIKEIGAIINDIQKFGDFAIDKWKEK